MAKCNVCGKKGLFLKVNYYGICLDCEKKRQQEEALRMQKLKEEKKRLDILRSCLDAEDEQNQEQDAVNFFSLLVDKFQFIKSDIDVNDDPVKRVDDIHLIIKKIEACDNLSATLDHYSDYKYFKKILCKRFEYKSEWDKANGYGWIKELSVGAWTKNNNFVEKVVEDLKADVEKYKNGWNELILRIRSDAEFQTELVSIPSYNIQLSNFSSPPKRQALGDIIFSNVTTRTVYERLGTFVVVDVETTGLKSMQDEIIEIGAIFFENWEPCLKFQTLIKPTKKIPSEIVSITGITNDMVENAPSFQQIIESLNDFIGNNNIVGHNLLFDLRFLYSSGYDFTTTKRRYYDTLELSKKVLSISNGEVSNHKLTTLCDYYRIRDNASGHRAISDCLATGKLFEKLSSSRIF